jgi:hypothetical protein
VVYHVSVWLNRVAFILVGGARRVHATGIAILLNDLILPRSGVGLIVEIIYFFISDLV